jgi:hypothetical protein
MQIKQLTKDEARRITEGRIETQQLIAKEESYPAHLRKTDYLAGLHAHIERLDSWLASGMAIINFNR